MLSAVWLAACAVKPEPISQAEHLKRAQDDYKTLYSTYVPLTAPLTLPDAIARALKYNYDAQLAKTEETLQDRQLDLAEYLRAFQFFSFDIFDDGGRLFFR